VHSTISNSHKKVATINGVRLLSPADEKFLDDLSRMARKISGKALEREHFPVTTSKNGCRNVAERNDIDETSYYCDQLSRATTSASMLKLAEEDEAGARAYKVLHTCIVVVLKH